MKIQFESKDFEVAGDIAGFFVFLALLYFLVLAFAGFLG